MLFRSDIPEAPWWVVESDNKRRSRLDMIHHLVSSIDYQPVERDPVRLPERPAPTGYVRPPRDSQRYVPDHASTLIGEQPGQA